jgi:hypothetical protein
MVDIRQKSAFLHATSKSREPQMILRRLILTMDHALQTTGTLEPILSLVPTPIQLALEDISWYTMAERDTWRELSCIEWGRQMSLGGILFIGTCLEMAVRTVTSGITRFIDHSIDAFLFMELITLLCLRMLPMM